MIYKNFSNILTDHGFVQLDRSIRKNNYKIAYIDNGKTQDKYICTSLISGHNTGKLLDSEHNDIKDMNSGGITLYTCNGSNWRDVTIVFFQKCS